MSEVRAVRVDPSDNVATLVQAGSIGNWAVWDGGRVQLREDAPAGHKVAVCSISRDGRVTKYGAPIGLAARAIEQGEWVHVHNVRSARGKGVRIHDSGLSPS